MSRVLGSLDNLSDRLSPIVVKEVRQMVRGREFNYSFGLSLVAGLIVAFWGGADALAGNGAAGSWIFAVLIGCLILFGFAIVPMGTFSVLRNERTERTFDLITLTALSPRRIVLGKLLAQGVKLVTLFAGLAPFIAMSFLLGGIDFMTILISLATVFMWSLWACAACLCLSSLSKSRAMSGLLLAGIALLFLFAISFGPTFYFMVFLGRVRGRGFSTTFGTTPSDMWWTLALMTSICLTTMANLVLLAENRLSLPTENRVTALRVGFLIQFLLIVAAAMMPAILRPSAIAWTNTLGVLGVLGGIHLALVSVFSVTEDLALSRRILLQDRSRRWRRLNAIFRPGGGRGAAYILAQMGVLLVAGWPFTSTAAEFRWLLMICCYICFFTGVPTWLGRRLAPGRARPAYLRVAAFLFFPALMLSADLLTYFLSSSGVFDGSYSIYHLVNPFRTLSNWPLVESNQWHFIVLGLGLIGLVSYLGLIRMGESANDNAGSAH